MIKNPFEIFGLTTEMVARLSEKELFSVLKSMYRALQKTVHPDTRRIAMSKGPVDKAVELNLAFEALNLDKNPVSFRRHRKAFVARRPRSVFLKSQLLQKELLQSVQREDALSEAYFQRLVSDYGTWPSIDSLQQDSSLPLIREPDGNTPSFPLKNVRLGLLDVAINQNLRQVSWTVGNNYKEIKFDEHGDMSLKPISRSRFSKISYIHLLGSVSCDDLELLPLLERPKGRFFKNAAINAKIGVHGAHISVLNAISQENFKKHVLRYLEPKIKERSYLFSFNRPQWEEEGLISLEGMVVKIERLR